MNTEKSKEFHITLKDLMKAIDKSLGEAKGAIKIIIKLCEILDQLDQKKLDLLAQRMALDEAKEARDKAYEEAEGGQ